MKELISQSIKLDHQAVSSRSLARNKAVEVSVAPVSRRQLAFRRLAEACKRKDFDRIKLTLTDKPELVNQHDEHNRTLLHYTSIRTTQANSNSHTSQDWNCDEGRKSIECLNYLTDRCDLRLWWHQDLDGLSLLHLAVISSNVCLVKHVIFEHPYSIKYPLVCTLDKELHSPLHWAVITNNIECVRLLIDFAGTKLAHEADLNGATPLHYATQTNDYPRYRQQLRNMLKSVGDPSESEETSNSTVTLEQVETRNHVQTESLSSICSRTKTTLSSSFNSNHESSTLQVLEFLVKLPQVNLECSDKDKRTPLLWAASSGNKEAILLLVQNGANLSSCDANRLGALHCAASHGLTDCLECLLSLSASGKLLEVDQADNMNCTALFYAVLSGNIDCIESLLDRGAQSNWQDVKGRTAAHFAALRGQLNSLKLLRDRGGNLWLANKQGDLPLHYAVKSGRQQVVRWLLDHSPYEHAVNAINNYGRAPIHLAVSRDNLQLVEYLIKCGANLNQLVKLRSSRNLSLQASRYETALDLANRMQLDNISELLGQQGAQSAVKVLAGRAQQVSLSKGASDTRTLFELQSVDGPSPIGPSETSETCTSTSASGAPSSTPIAAMANVPKLMRPSAVANPLPQSDSTGSSSLSQNSLTCVRGLNTSADSVPPLEQTGRPYTIDEPSSYKRGGISYKNELMNASIKCKLYDREQAGHHSFPPVQRAGERSSNIGASQQLAKSQLKSSRSTDTQLGNKVITNVNVFTPPCSRCTAQEKSVCQVDNNPKKYVALDQHRSWVTDDTSSVNSSASSDRSEQTDSRHQLPNLVDQELPAKMAPLTRSVSLNKTRLQETSMPLPLIGRHLPPSQSHEQRLPVILSDRERSASNSGLEQTCDELADSRPILSSSLERRRSPADEEPRFDWSDRGQRGPNRYPDSHVQSPVGEYIRQTRMSQPGRSKVRGPPRYASRSQSRQSQPSRASSRATTLGYPPARRMQRSSSTDSFELATRVEKSIRKFKQEKKVFEELQNLKRSQIRSGRANEALLVKRLVEHYKLESQHCSEMLGLDQYHGPYEYLAYERFLYDQLRKLSPTNSAKLAGWPDDQLVHGREQMQDQQSENPKHFEEEDLQAELELQRVIGNQPNQPESDKINMQTQDAPEMLQYDQQAIVDQSEARAHRTSISSVCSSRRSSVEIEQEKLLNLPLRVQADEIAPSDIEEHAGTISSSIIVDALGNISRASLATSSPAHESVGPHPSENYATDTIQTVRDAPTSSAARRRFSVVNIGNKLETIEHQVGIEIDPADSSPAASDQEQELARDRVVSDESRADQLEEISEHGDSEAEVDTVIVRHEFDQDQSEQSQDVEAGDVEKETCDNDHLAGELPDDQQSVSQLAADMRLQALEKGVQAQPISISRRASSPHMADYREATKEGSVGSSSRRASLDHLERKKVFNGYDLDEMRARCSRRRAGRKLPRLARSKLVQGRYEPLVDVESVRQRWAPIKASSKRRLGRSSQLVSSFGKEGAKSHADFSSSQAPGDETEPPPSYTLLYEINKSACEAPPDDQLLMRHGQEQAEKALRWCQRRAVRIVDVRTLKRTLSLPESLIYSNDLLKRFNILKL